MMCGLDVHDIDSSPQKKQPTPVFFALHNHLESLDTASNDICSIYFDHPLQLAMCSIN